MAAIPEKFANNHKALEYIGFLAASTGTDISTWNIPEIFIGVNLQSLILDASEINQRFFKKIQEVKAAAKKKRAPKLLITEEQLTEASALRQPGGSKYQPMIANQNYNIQSYETAMRDYNNSIKTYADKVEKAKEELARLQAEWEKTKATPLGSLKDQIKMVVKDGFFSDFKYHGGYLWCLTAKDVMMRSQQVRTNFVNLGRFCLQINMKNFETRVYPHENNLYGGHQDARLTHPFHTDYDYHFCRTETKDFQEAVDSMDLHKYLTLMAALLQDSSGQGGRHMIIDDARLSRNPAFQTKHYPKDK